MELGIKGRVAIVTGGTKGIGQAIVKTLAREGVRVVTCARGVKAIEILKNEVAQEGSNLLTLAADMNKPEDIRRVIDKTVEYFGGVDILVNNVGGIKKMGHFKDLNDQDWIETFELNVMSVVRFVREVLPTLKQSRFARIINISSISGVQPGFYNPHYTTTKSAVINLSKYLANQLAAEKILVNVVCPGPVHSGSWDRSVEELARQRHLRVEEMARVFEDEERRKIPLGRVGEGEDVSGLVAFLASDHASWITGSCFHVNGGKLRSMD